MKDLIELARRKAVRLERLLDDRVNALVRTPDRGLEPLEVRAAVLDEIESRTVPGPKGTCLFPFDEVRVELLGGTSEEIAALEATLDSDGGLEAAARARLVDRSCPAPALVVRVASAATEPGTIAETRYRVAFRRGSVRPAQEPIAPTLVVTVGSGTAATRCELAHGRLDIGRVADVRDRDGRLVRENALVIPDTYDPHGTVSRRHVHITATSNAAGHVVFRVYDDGSRYGTDVVRHGHTIAVHAGPPGVTLRDGDELHLGEASASVSLVAPDAVSSFDY